MPNEREENPLGKVGNWMTSHRRTVYVIFLALAGLNGWLSYQMFAPHPLLALANAAMALLLAIFVISTWGLK